MKKLCGLAVMLSMTCGPAYAHSIGFRGALTDFDADEKFEAYELFLIFNLPWSWDQGESRVRTQLEITGGALDAAGVSGSLGMIGPRLAFETDRVTWDLGVGVAGLGETEFGEHSFGGSAQFIAQAGLSVAVLDRLNLGVRIRHMSDGDTHEGSRDLNLVLAELSFDFGE